MNVNAKLETVQVSFRLDRRLVKRMRKAASAVRWPPPPSQTEMVAKGVELVLNKLKRQRKARAKN